MSKEKLTVLNRISSPSQKFNKIALSIALLTAGSEVFAQQYILDGPTASGSITGAYTYEGTVNNPAAIAVMNGGKLTTSSSITALPYDLNGYSILVTGANSRIDVISRGLRANLGEAPGSTGLFVSEGTFNSLNSWFVAHTASSNEMAGKVTGIHAISGATVTVEGAQINLFPTRDYANSTLTGTNAILIEHGNSNVQDTTVTTSGQLLIQLQGNEGHGVYVLNDSAIATDAKDGVMRIYGLENAIDIIGNNSYALATGKTTYGTSRIFVGDEQTSAKGTIAITTQGTNAHGIVTAPKGEIKLYGDGQTIKTVGAGASDLVSNGGVIDITGDGHQLTTMDAHAVVASGGGTINIRNSSAFTGNAASKIQAQGIGSNAILASGDATAVNLTQLGGTISAQADVFSANTGAGITAVLDAVQVTQSDNLINARSTATNIRVAADHNSILIGNIRSTEGANALLTIDNGSTFTGDIVADSSSLANITLNRSDSTSGTTLWTGAATNTNDVTLKSVGTKWVMTDNSTVANLTNSGSIIFGEQTRPENSFNTLTTRNLTGGGTFDMRVNMATEQGDLIRADIVDGGHLLKIQSDASQNTKGTESLVVVNANDSNNASFTLASGNSTVESGGYNYYLRRAANPQDWILSANMADPVPEEPEQPTSPEEPTAPTAEPDTSGGKNITSTADAAANFINSSYLMNYAETQTLLQRMGDLRDSHGDGNLWARSFAGRFDNFAQGKLSGFTMNYHGVQFGGDKRFDLNDDNLYVGLMVGLSNSSQDLSKNNGDASLSSQNVGLYSSYMSADGLYVDALVKYTHFKHSFSVNDSDNHRVGGNDSTNGIATSLEIGQRFYPGQDKKFGFYIEPQAQISYAYQEGINVKATNGLVIDSDSYNSTLGRTSILFGYKINEAIPTNIYLKTGYVYEFDGKIDYRLNGSSESHDNGGGWWNNGLGITTVIKNQHNFYMEVDSSTGHKFNQRQINAGYRYNF